MLHSNEWVLRLSKKFSLKFQKKLISKLNSKVLKTKKKINKNQMLHGTIQQYLNYSKYEMTKQIDQKNPNMIKNERIILHYNFSYYITTFDFKRYT